MMMTVSVSETAFSMMPISNFWVASVAFGVVSILILMLCARKKKKNSVTMIRYVKNDEMDPEAQHSRSSTNNGPGNFERQTEQRISQNSLPNENRTLPEIPKNGGITNGAPPTPEQTGTPGAASGESTQRNSASSPKKSRRLPALPPSGQVDLAQAAELARDDRDNDGTYEDLRDDNVNTANPIRDPTVGARDSALYAKVPDDLQKQEDEDNDLYAQVGDDSDQKPGPSSSQTNDDKTRNKSSSSEDDKTMDSPTAVTYASVDKMKKTMSIKRTAATNTSAAVPPPPPVPDRNFDEDEVRDTEDSQTAVPLLSQSNTVDQSQTNHDPVDNAHETDETEETGPAYDTVSVRESFAHQRLRQMVEDEQMNRYVNTTRSPDLYSQIDEENPEAVYESVSVPGSADGTVGVTGRNINASTTAQNSEEVATPQEDAYSTIGGARTNTNAAVPPPPPNGEVSNPNYEDIVPLQN